MKCTKCGFEQEKTHTCIKCGFVIDRQLAQTAATTTHRKAKISPRITLAGPKTQTQKIICSTGEIPFSYDILDVIFAYGNSKETAFRGNNPIQAYKSVTTQLQRAAEKMGADAVIYIRYDYRVAVDKGFGSSSLALQI